MGPAVSGKIPCHCECGTERMVAKYSLETGQSKSCGCLRRELLPTHKVTHGHGRKGKQSGTYKSWSEMLARCRNPKSRIYSYYGGRGISVCDRWIKFENFLADMGGRPVGKSLDRIDVDGNYEPENCRWATATEQARNTRSNHRILCDGRMMTVAEAAEIKGLRKRMVYLRLSAGWSVERALAPATRAPKTDIRSGVKGVSWSVSKKKWVASIYYQGKTVPLGRYDTIEDAHKVRLRKEAELFGVAA